MSRTIHPVDIDELMRSMNPLTAEPSSTDVDLALQRLLSSFPRHRNPDLAASARRACASRSASRPRLPVPLSLR